MPHHPATLTSLPGYLRGLAGLGLRPALIEQHLYRSQSYSYAELMGKAYALQRELGRRGVRAGDRIMIWGSSGAGWAAAFYGCVLAGAVVVPLDSGFSAGLAARVQQQTEAVLLCSDHEPLAGVPRLSFEQIVALPPEAAPEAAPEPGPETLLEIVFTSGATADPKGVMITHGNLLANLRPISGEIEKYLARARPFLPLRFLHLIPLSHLFGQVMGLLIPPLLESAVVYPESQAPAQWAELIRRYRASVMVAVPQQLTLFSQWAAGAADTSLEEAAAISKGRNIPWRWWRWRKLHRRLGWKMWAFVVGGASLATQLEDFWNGLGYAVVQGYGLTETAPAITITHPFKARRGAVGRALAGVETRIGADGEILVRGGNVSPGYYHNPEATAEAFAGGWLHTGDLGRLDEEGNLTFLGRKKEVIVTSAGLNVYPDDVERALAQQPAIEECAAVEDQRQGAAQVHAVVVLRAGEAAGALAAAVAAANAQLEPHQRISAASVWPQPHLPRTTSTRKLQRLAIARWVNQGEPAAPESPADGEGGGWKQFLERRWGLAPSRLQPQARLDSDLGLSSLDRVELWSWLEAHTPGGLDEAGLTLAQTVAEVDALLAPAERAAAAAAGRGRAAAPGRHSGGGEALAAAPRAAPLPRAELLRAGVPGAAHGSDTRPGGGQGTFAGPGAAGAVGRQPPEPAGRAGHPQGAAARLAAMAGAGDGGRALSRRLRPARLALAALARPLAAGQRALVFQRLPAQPAGGGGSLAAPQRPPGRPRLLPADFSGRGAHPGWAGA